MFGVYLLFVFYVIVFERVIVDIWVVVDLGGGVGEGLVFICFR